MEILFDWTALADAVREHLAFGDTIKGTAEKIGIKSHQLHRLLSERAVSIEALLATCRWLDKKVEDYVISPEVGTENIQS